ncbi:YicC family protein [bacterium]|nr:YicC family protein [bacterium]
MPNSMTGFGKASIRVKNYEYTCEIRSVNSRYRDVKCTCPKDMVALEHKVEKMIQNYFSRGKFSVVLQRNSLSRQKKISFEEKSIIAHWKTLDGIRKKMGLKEPLNMEALIHIDRGIFVNKKPLKKDIYQIEKNYLKVMQKGLDNLKESRKREGKGIEKVMLKLQNNVNKYVKKIEQEFKRFQKGLSKKIKVKLAQLPKDYVQDNKKYESDLVSLKDKTDITEELDRLSIHLKRLRVLLTTQGVVGREMDFLMQEINREINTIGSKSSEVKISNQVIMLKTDMEKLREQAQNLE